MRKFLLAALFLVILLLSVVPAHAEGQWWWCGTIPCSSENDHVLWLPQVAK